MSEAKELNLYQKIQAVSNEVKNIEKNKTVGSGSYSYKAVQDIDVLLAVKKAEMKHGLISIPVKQELIKSEIVKVQKDKGGEAINYVDIVKMTIRIFDIKKPTDFIEVESFGRGLDTGDKGFGKASTYARKYALLNAYKIATGEDPDDNKSKEQKALPENERKNAVFDYMEKDNNYLQNILKYFNLGSLDDMTQSQIDTTYNNLVKKRLI